MAMIHFADAVTELVRQFTTVRAHDKDSAKQRVSGRPKADTRTPLPHASRPEKVEDEDAFFDSFPV